MQHYGIMGPPLSTAGTASAAALWVVLETRGVAPLEPH